MQVHTKGRRTDRGGMHVTVTDAKGREVRRAILLPADVKLVWHVVQRLNTVAPKGKKVLLGGADEGPPVPWETVAKGQLKEGGPALSVRAKRKRAGLSQAALAAALGIKQANVSEIENGKRPIGKVLARRLAKFFDADYRVFL